MIYNILGTLIIYSFLIFFFLFSCLPIFKITEIRLLYLQETIPKLKIECLVQLQKVMPDRKKYNIVQQIHSLFCLDFRI